jgi:hypothetical protein
MMIQFIPRSTSNLLVKAKLTINGKAGSGAGNALATSIVEDTLWGILIDKLTLPHISDLKTILESVLKPTASGTKTEVFITVTDAIDGRLLGEESRTLTGTAASFPIVGPYLQDKTYGNQTVEISIVVQATTERPIRIFVGSRSIAKSWGLASSVVNFQSSEPDSRVDFVEFSVR